MVSVYTMIKKCLWLPSSSVILQSLRKIFTSLEKYLQKNSDVGNGVSQTCKILILNTLHSELH